MSTSSACSACFREELGGITFLLGAGNTLAAGAGSVLLGVWCRRSGAAQRFSGGGLPLSWHFAL